MKLLKFFTRIKKQEIKKDYFLALELNRNFNALALWHITAGKITIEKTARAGFEDPEGETSAVLKNLETVKEKLPPGLTVSNTVLGVNPDCVQNDKINKNVLEKVKLISSACGLKPVGFVTIPEALSYFLKKEEGIPLSAILLGAGIGKLDITVYRAGKKTKETSSEIKNDIAAGLEKIFSGLGAQDILPSKIILYHAGKDPSLIRDILLAYQWQNKSYFLHFPKFEILSETAVVKAVAVSGAGELVKSLEIPKDDAIFADKTDAPDVKEKETPEDDIDEKGGFEKSGQLKSDNREEILSPEALGFYSNEQPVIKPETSAETPVYETEEESYFSAPETKSNRLKFFPGAIPRRLILLAGAAVLLLSGLALAFAYRTMPKAKLTILIDPRAYDETFQFALDPEIKNADEKTRIIPALVIETDIAGSKTAMATGSKKVGDPARGSVLILNKTTSAKTFKKGAILKANQNLKFTLDNETSVPSASESGDGLNFGKAKSKITAGEIGPEGNLAADTVLSFAELPESSYAARISEALTGGSSRMIKVVSKKDQEQLLSGLTAELKDKSLSLLTDKITAGEKIIRESITIAAVSKKFEKDVNDQTDVFALEISGKAKAYAYKENDAQSFIKKALSLAIPDDYELKSDSAVIETNNFSVKKDGKAAVSLTYKALLFPKFDFEIIRQKIAGKNKEQAQDYLKKQKGVIGVEINIFSSLPFGQNTLPYQTKNITLEVDKR